MINNIVKFISKYCLAILIFLLVFIIITPIVINLLFCCHKISPDGYLTYIGTLVATLTGFFTALVAIYNSNIAEEIDEKDHKIKIAPILSIELNEINGFYELCIENHSEYIAKNIYLFDKFLRVYVKKNKPEHIILDKKDIDKGNFKFEEEQIKELDILYCDVDDNVIKQTFRRNENGNYESGKNDIEYID